MESRVVVIFETDDMRGDHAADVEVTKLYPPETALSKVLADALTHGIFSGARATIKIVPCDEEET